MEKENSAHYNIIENLDLSVVLQVKHPWTKVVTHLVTQVNENILKFTINHW